MDLQWVPRGENTLAVELTNQDYSSFCMEDRINVEFKDIQWQVLPEILQVSGDLYRDVCRQREQHKLKNHRDVNKGKKRPATGKLKWTDPW